MSEIRKIRVTIPISREVAIDHGIIEPTPEEQARAEEAAMRWRGWSEQQSAVRARMRDALDALTDPVVRLVLDLHHEADAQCQGCDPGDYAESGAEWPCSTVKAIAKHYGIQTDEPYPMEHT